MLNQHAVSTAVVLGGAYFTAGLVEAVLTVRSGSVPGNVPRLHEIPWWYVTLAAPAAETVVLVVLPVSAVLLLGWLVLRRHPGPVRAAAIVLTGLLAGVLHAVQFGLAETPALYIVTRTAQAGGIFASMAWQWTAYRTWQPRSLHGRPFWRWMLRSGRGVALITLSHAMTNSALLGLTLLAR